MRQHGPLTLSTVQAAARVQLCLFSLGSVLSPVPSSQCLHRELLLSPARSDSPSPLAQLEYLEKFDFLLQPITVHMLTSGTGTSLTLPPKGYLFTQA